MKKFIFSLVLTVLSFIGIQAVYAQRTGAYTLTYTDSTDTSKPVKSNIYFQVPTDYDSEKTYPFLMGWHGAGDNGNNTRNFFNILLASRVGAILVCPDANALNGKASIYLLNLTNAAYSEVRTKYNIDTTKMIVMGFSWGGGIAYQLGLLYPQLFTGIIGLAPAIGSFNQPLWDNIMKVRMATILGDRDFNYAAVNSLMNTIKARKANLLYLVKPGVQHVDNVYFNSQACIDDFRQCYDFVTNTETGVAEEQAITTDQLTVFPNPSSDFIFVTGKSKEIDESIEIYSIEGVKVSDYMTNTALDVSNLAAGMYFVKSGTRFCTFIKK
ncbi:MAG: putative polyhydroxybutyrate depolymerase [Ignavibacteria bacterium]|nr:putative polyhydroxybutyrate depolymerase [Ignavibacteria bacterium]